MDGAKSVTDTADLLRECDRQAFREGKSFPVRGNEPRGNENPGGSRNLAECESLPPEGQGFLDNVNQSRVSRS